MVELGFGSAVFVLRGAYASKPAVVVQCTKKHEKFVCLKMLGVEGYPYVKKSDIYVRYANSFAGCTVKDLLGQYVELEDIRRTG